LGKEEHGNDHLLDDLAKRPDFPMSFLPIGPIGVAQARAEVLGAEDMVWLTYHEERQAGWTVFEDINIIAYISDAAGFNTVLKAIDVTPYFDYPRDFMSDKLIVIPSEVGAVMMAAVWDAQVSKTTQNMLLIDTVAMELVTMLNTRETVWFDLSLNGLFTSYLGQDTLTTIDIERAYVTRNNHENPIVAYMLDEHLLESVSSQTATMLNTSNFSQYTDRFYWGSYPLAQATNDEVLVRITDGDEAGDYQLRADTHGRTVLQERYLLTSKDAKRDFYRWLRVQPRDSTAAMFAANSAN